LACPVKYRWSYIDRRYQWFVKAKSYYSFGTSLHQVLERFHDSQDLGVQTTSEAVAALEENWMTSGYSSPEEAAEALAEGRVLVEGYVATVREAEEDSTTLFVEKELQKDMGDWTLSGRLDRITERQDGVIEIIDYKTGSVAAESPIYDIAMGCYALLALPLFPEKRLITTIVSLRNGERTSAERTPEELAEFEADLRKLASNILNRDYPTIDPKPKQLCINCDFLRVCATHPDFTEDFAVFGSIPEDF
jgi:RecB family exonuclease